MAYRFTNTDKWQDVWFSNLSQIQMLLFLYLCDNCDIAGFIEINIKRWSSDLSSSSSTIEGAIKGLERGLIFSKNSECLYIKNFLKHQKNLPLNENNKAHKGIIKRFDLYSQKFDIQSIDEFLSRGYEGALKGLNSPTGNGNGIDNNSSKYIYSLFYDSEIEKSKNNEEYIKFVKVLFGENNLKQPLNNVLKLKNQLTFEQFPLVMQKKKDYNCPITATLENMENKPDLAKKYTSLQRTLLNWMKPKEQRK